MGYAHGMIKIQNLDGVGDVSVTNMQGTTMMHKHYDGTSAEIATDQLQAGIYIVKAGAIAKKLVIK